MSHLLALDLGTSAIKCLLMDKAGKVLQVNSVQYPSYSPSPGWTEQQPDDWVKAAVSAVKTCMSHADKPDIAAISLSGHMSGLVVIDKHGEPLFPCITLSDIRSHTQADFLRRVTQRQIQQMTGNPVIDAFLAPKLLWLKENHPDLYNHAYQFIFPKDYLRYFLTGMIGTDLTDAGNTLFYDPGKQEWNFDLVEQMGFRPSLLPRLFRPYDIAGKLNHSSAKLLGLHEGIPVVAGAADMATGALGTGAVSIGDAVLTIGTSASMVSIVPDIHPDGFHKVTFHPHAIPDVMYALGSHFSGGLSLNWFSNIMSRSIDFSFIQSLSHDADNIPPGSNGVFFMPFLVGSGSPHFHSHMRGGFLGLNNSTDQPAMFRAVLEGIGYNLKETLALFGKMNGSPAQIRIGGGGAKIGGWPKILANIFGCPVQILKHADASAIGAAIIGGYAVGMFNNMKNTASRLSEITQTIMPDPTTVQQYKDLYEHYLELYAGLEPVYQKLNRT